MNKQEQCDELDNGVGEEKLSKSNFHPEFYEKLIEKFNIDELRIAYVLQKFPTLSETFILNELRWLKENGFNVKVFSYNNPRKPVEPDFDLEVIRFDQTKDLSNNLEKLLLEHNINLIHTHFVYPTGTLYTYPIAEKLKIPFTIFAHAYDIFVKDNDLRNNICEISKSDYCKAIFTLSNYHKNYLMERGVPQEKIVLTKQATEYEVLPLKNQNKSIKNIISISRFVEKKGLDTLIKAAEILKNEDLTFSIYGYGDLEDELQELIDLLNLKNISIKGILNNPKEVKEVFDNSDLLVSPCKIAKTGDRDGFPTVIFESMGYGVPVLTTNVSAIPEIITDLENGFLVEPNNPQELADKIREICLLSSEEIFKITKNAQNDVKNISSTEKTMKTLLNTWFDLKSKKIVSITTIKNEADIIESFIRYHLNIVDEMIILDNGSTDDTHYILNELLKENLPIIVIQDDDKYFEPQIKYNNLLKKAIVERNADIICPLDCDEFITCAAGNPRNIIEKIPPLTFYKIKWKTYIPTEKDDFNIKFVPQRINHIRDESLENLTKVILTKEAYLEYGGRLTIGNHNVRGNDEFEENVKIKYVNDLKIAHFPLRSIKQTTSKVLVNYPNTLSRKEVKQGMSFHYTILFDKIKNNHNLSMNDVTEFAKQYSLEHNKFKEDFDKNVEIPIKLDPMNLDFCQNTDIKYPFNEEPLKNVLENYVYFAKEINKFKNEIQTQNENYDDLKSQNDNLNKKYSQLKQQMDDGDEKLECQNELKPFDDMFNNLNSYSDLNLNDNSKRVGIFIKESSVSSDIRLLTVFDKLSMNSDYLTFVIKDKDMIQVEKDLKDNKFLFDYIIIQRNTLDQKNIKSNLFKLIVEKCKLLNMKLIFEIDDDLINMDESNPGHKYYMSLKEDMEFLSRNADVITVSTGSLKKSMSYLNDKIVVIPNRLTDSWLLNDKNEDFDSNKNIFKIGYMGTIYHSWDLILIKEAIHNVKKYFEKENKKVIFEMIGGTEEELTWCNQIEIPPNKTRYLPFIEWFKSVAKWDVALAPLEISNLNESKSELKYLEYSALGVPGIYSDVGPYKRHVAHEKTGLLVKTNNTQEWEKNIINLIKDTNLRKTILNNSKKDIVENYLIKDSVNQWLGILNELTEKPKISIIIPIFNSQDFIEDCLNSILNQSFKDLEVICVDDGSTDNSLNILKKYKEKDGRVKLYSQENAGAAQARNLGMQKSHGEYIQFVDSDDWIEKDTCEQLYNQATSLDADVILFNSIEHKPNNEFRKRIYFRNNSFKHDFKTFTFDYNLDKNMVMNGFLVIWSKFYKSSFLKENNIKFYNHEIFNDIQFHIPTMIFAKKIAYNPSIFYHYNRLGQPSLQNSNVKTKKSFVFFDICKEIQEFFIDNNIMEKFKNNFIRFVLTETKNNLIKVNSETKVSFFNNIKILFNELNINSDDLKDLPLENYKFYINVVNCNDYFEYYSLTNNKTELLDYEVILLNRINEKNDEIFNLTKQNNELKEDNNILINMQNDFLADDSFIESYYKILDLNLFDEEYYRNQEGYNGNVNPYIHYIYKGFKEGKNPSKLFNTEFYMNYYKNLNMNPLIHFVNIGLPKGQIQIRKGLPKFRAIDKPKINEKIKNFNTKGVTNEKRNPQLIVSLTSYPKRIKNVKYALYSLFNQKLKPDKIILWLSPSQFPNKENDLPKEVLNFKEYGLEIKWCEDIKSFKKLIPSLREFPNDLIVTVDDDIYMDENWLTNLYACHLKYPNNIISTRARRISFNNDNINPYSEWNLIKKESKASFLNFITGAGGILYPPNALDKQVFNQDLFMNLTPTGDDIWFWAMAVKKGTKMQVIEETLHDLTYVSPDEECNLFGDSEALWQKNSKGLNDISIKRIFNEFPEIYEKIKKERLE